MRQQGCIGIVNAHMHRNAGAQAQFLRQEDTFSTCVLAIVIDNFGTESLSWEPGTLNQELLATLGVEATDLLSDKLQAANTLLTTNLFHVSLESFNTMVQVFSFQEADFRNFVPAEMDEIAWGAYAGVSFSVELFERSLRIKPNLSLIRYEMDFFGLVSDAK